jgi:hypothetical protein
MIPQPPPFIRGDSFDGSSRSRSSTPPPPSSSSAIPPSSSRSRSGTPTREREEILESEPTPPVPTQKKTVNFRQYFLLKLQKPEVAIMGVWWIVLFGLVLHLAETWSVLLVIFKPLMFLIAVPAIFLGFLFVYA